MDGCFSESLTKFADSNLSSKCVYSRKILSFIDLSEDNRVDPKFVEHLSKCEICKKQLKKSMAFLDIIDEHVPVVKSKRSTVDSTKREISGIFKELSVKDNENDKFLSEYESLIQTSKQFCRDFSSIMFSPTSMVVYSFAVGLGLIISLI